MRIAVSIDIEVDDQGNEFARRRGTKSTCNPRKSFAAISYKVKGICPEAKEDINWRSGWQCSTECIQNGSDTRCRVDEVKVCKVGVGDERSNSADALNKALY
jgi:hypothetical protein